MPKLLCVLVTFFLVSPLVTAEIFKCTREGKSVYQNFPCDVDSIGSQATAPRELETPVAASAPVEVAPRAARTKVAVAEQPVSPGAAPRIGMTKKQVKASTWGNPIDMVKEEVVEGSTETWNYDYARKRTVVFGTNGHVTDVTQ